MTTPALHVMVDGHVHLHDHFSLQRLFLICLQNFRKALQKFQIYEPFEAFLLLTESFGKDRFAEVRKIAGHDLHDDFRVETTDEDTTVRIITSGGQTLHLVSGRQIVTAERLEVLALGYRGSYPDGRPIAYVLDDLAETSALRVIPWGAGKWLGKRGAIIQSLVTSWNSGPLFLGDNGNRPSFWPLPPVFEQARRNNIHNLPGSDPLPFPEQEKKAGGYGFMLRGAITSETPFSSLKAHILEGPQKTVPFGTPEKLIPFLKNQITMQVAGRKK